MSSGLKKFSFLNIARQALEAVLFKSCAILSSGK